MPTTPAAMTATVTVADVAAILRQIDRWLYRTPADDRRSTIACIVIDAADDLRSRDHGHNGAAAALLHLAYSEIRNAIGQE